MSYHRTLNDELKPGNVIVASSSVAIDIIWRKQRRRIAVTVYMFEPQEGKQRILVFGQLSLSKLKDGDNYH